MGGPLVRLKPPLHASGGSAYYQVDLSALNIGPGSYFFQFWFRDPAAGGAQFNLSDALEVSFVQ